MSATRLANTAEGFLLDENLAERVARGIRDTYMGVVHVADVGLLGASDSALWRHARENGLAIITKDEDFHRLSVLHGPPPKIIWLRLGNCSTDDVIRLLLDRRAAIEAFLRDEDSGFLALA